MNKRGFISFLIIVIILGALIACGVWYYQAHKANQSLPTGTTATQEADVSTSSWKTYSNSQFGFQFQYPPNNTISDKAPSASQSGTQPDSLDTLQVSGSDSDLAITVFAPGIVRGDYNWPERPCGEWTFGPDSGPLSSEDIVFAGQKTLHLVTRIFGSSSSTNTNNFYCVNYSRNPIVMIFNQPPSIETQKILDSFQFFTTTQ